eukprot:99891-Rhodomonas_salina.3
MCADGIAVPCRGAVWTAHAVFLSCGQQARQKGCGGPRGDEGGGAGGGGRGAGATQGAAGVGGALRRAAAGRPPRHQPLPLAPPGPRVWAAHQRVQEPETGGGAPVAFPLGARVHPAHLGAWAA